MTTVILVRDTNGNTLGRCEVEVAPAFITGADVRVFDSGEGLVVTLELEE